MREPNLLFLDVASTSHFFKSAGDAQSPETGVLKSAVALARELGFDAKAAISDTAAGAQAFAYASNTLPPNSLPSINQSNPFPNSPSYYICVPGEERENLATLALPLLLQLEGLLPWQNPRAIEQIVTFFYMLGFSKISDLDRFSLTSMQDRWGEVGGLLWKRIHGLEQQVVSPLLPTEPLRDYLYLDFPLSLASLLLHQVQRSLTYLFARLQGRCLYARKLQVHLYCEYSETGYTLEIEPNNPSRNLDLFLTLLENKLDGIDLENPIREFEIEIIPVPERTQQLDFFEPRNSDTDKFDSLLSLLKQASLRTGRYQVRDAIMPEQSWETFSGYEGSPAALGDSYGNTAVAFAEKTETRNAVEKAYQLLPEYGISTRTAPRPSRLLRTPRRLPIHELQRIRLLTGHPIERLEDAWWENREGAVAAPFSAEKRDYYFAVSSEGQCLWIYQNLETQEYYLHGYFD